MRAPGVLRTVAAVLIGSAIAVYFVLALRGKIGKDNRVTPAELGVLVAGAVGIGVLLKPEFFDRLRKFDIAGVKVELGEVRKSQMEVQKQQDEQRAMIEDIRLALRLLIGERERVHLLNLFHRRTDTYEVRGALRDEIRRLRTMNLIRMRPDKTVAGMPANAQFNLGDFVELTEDGFRFVSRMNEIAAEQAAGPVP